MIEKPQTTTLEVMDYNKAAKWISYKLGYDIRDVFGCIKHYTIWCKTHGEIEDKGSQEQFKRYKNAPDGDAECPAYRDYWHFILYKLGTINSGSIIKLGSWLSEDDSEPWQDEITQKFVDEFGDNREYLVKW
jgi:hypothetical protein